MTARATPPPPDGSVLVRVRADTTAWVADLPAVPGGQVLTVTVGHPSLLAVPADDLVARGYRLLGAGDGDRSVGAYVDVFVPADVRADHPGWWRDVAEAADRVFDLRMGPVWAVLGEELELHLAASG